MLKNKIPAHLQAEITCHLTSQLESKIGATGKPRQPTCLPVKAIQESKKYLKSTIGLSEIGDSYDPEIGASLSHESPLNKYKLAVPELHLDEALVRKEEDEKMIASTEVPPPYAESGHLEWSTKEMELSRYRETRIINSYLSGKSKSPCLLHGRAGSGKSSLLRWAISRFKVSSVNANVFLLFL
ncbi:unnamed protein product [Protopolystoma xenopodis]|uniref:Uncharacterized protein n=1 Tax=Protopolystoma xenopodis TaxID=117903 RepID=A0A3S5AV19_9PLAT|nr:unnamed protein product [Protopolystoma xenopodis]